MIFISENKRKVKRISALVMAVVMTLSLLGLNPDYTNVYGDSKSTGKVVVSVEKFSIGQGFIVEPVVVEYEGDTTVAKVFDQVMKSKSIQYKAGGSTEDGFYITSIKNADNGKLNIPEKIAKMESVNLYGMDYSAPSNENNDGNKDAPDLGEYAYNSMAGWFYSVNGKNTNAAASDIDVKDGDVIRFQFSVYGWGADIGLGYGMPMNVELPYKENLISVMAAANTQAGLSNASVKSAYDNAKNVVSSYDSTEEDINRAITLLSVSMTKIIENATETTTPEGTTKPEQTTKPEKNTTVAQQKNNKASIKKISNVKGKKAKLTLVKVSSASGYQIKYSVGKTMHKPTIVNTKKLNYTTKKLKKGKTYYFKVRAYKKINNTKYYSKWSSKKHVKITK